MRSCGVHRRGSGGTFALGRPVFAAMRLRYGGWDCCEPKRKKLRGAHTGNDTMGATPVPASPSPSTRDEVARSENLPEPYRGPSRAIVAPQVRPPARPARENGGFPTSPQEKDRREEENNMIERLNKEIRRRTRVVGGFPDSNSALMLVCARIRYVTANEWPNRRYLDTSRLDDNLVEANRSSRHGRA